VWSALTLIPYGESHFLRRPRRQARLARAPYGPWLRPLVEIRSPSWCPVTGLLAPTDR
jgi:hypothetical protein